MPRTVNAFGDRFTQLNEKRSLQFEGRYRVPKNGGTLVSFSTETSGGADFFVAGAKLITVRYHVTTGSAQAKSLVEVLNNPDSDFSVIVAGTSHSVTAGADANTTAGNIATAVGGGASRTSASASGELVTLTRSDSGIEQNRQMVLIPNNLNSDGTQRFAYTGFFFDGASVDSTNDTTFNLYGRTSSAESVGSGTSVFDTATSTGRTGSNVLYTFDESIVGSFDSMRATWSGLTAGDAISIYIKREF